MRERYHIGDGRGVTVRDATEQDIVPILAIYNHAIETTTAVFSYEPHTLQMRREWFESKLVNGHPVLVAVRGDRVAGFATYGAFRAWPAYSHTVEHSVYTAPEFRRQGIARSLMNALISRARASGLHAMVGGVVAENIESIRLHESLGFSEVAHFREVGYKFGRWLDLKFFELLLGAPDGDASSEARRAATVLTAGTASEPPPRP